MTKVKSFVMTFMEHSGPMRLYSRDGDAVRILVTSEDLKRDIEKLKVGTTFDAFLGEDPMPVVFEIYKPLVRWSQRELLLEAKVFKAPA